MRSLTILRLIVWTLIVDGASAQAICDKELSETVEKSSIYTCRNGIWRPQACILPSDGTRLDIGRVVETRDVVYQCDYLTENEPFLKAIACLSDTRQRVSPRETVVQNGRLMECSRLDVLNLNLAPISNETPPAGVTVRGDSAAIPSMPTPVQTPKPSTGTPFVSTSYSNRVTRPGGISDSSATAAPSKPTSERIPSAVVPRNGRNQLDGCNFDGKQYSLLSDMRLSDTWWRCEASPTLGAEPKLMGCMDMDDAKRRLDERVQRGFFEFRCDRIGNGAGWRGVACLERYPNGTTGTFAVGSRWLVGPDTRNSRYIMECASDGSNNIRRRGVQCFFNTTSGVGVMEGGCVTMIGDVLAQCLPASNDLANVRVRVKERATADEQRQMLADGSMKSCNLSPLPSSVVH